MIIMDFSIKYKEIEQKDNQTKNQLNDKYNINFHSNCGCEFIKIKDDEIKIDNKIFYPHIEYERYIKCIKKDKKYCEIYKSDDIVLEISKIKLSFDYPFNNQIIVTITADDADIGFTRYELIDKIMKYYHLLLRIEYDYDFDFLIFNEDRGSNILKSCDMFDKEIGISGIQYDKNQDVWSVIYDNYI